MGDILIPYRGIFEITGGIDTGKTLASLGVVYPYDKTIFIDADIKGKGTVKQLKDAGVSFGKYVDITRLQTQLGDTQTPDQLLNKVVLPVVDDIFRGPNQDVIIWDNWNIVYQSARMYVDKNRSQFNNIVTFQGNSIIIQGLVSRVARMIERAQIDKLSQKCEILIITSHLKDYYVNNVAVGERPETSKNFDEICSMRLWLKRNPKQSQVPTAIFLKRPNIPKVIDGVLEFVNIVPEKVTPRKGDKSIWQSISRYEENPVGTRAPEGDEVLTPEEFATISGELTNDQKSYIIDVLKYQKEEQEEVANIVDSITAKENESVEENEEYKNGINGDVDEDYPPIEYPKTGVAFIAKAFKDFGMTGKDIKDTLDIGVDKLMDLPQQELEKLWETLLKISK